MLCRFGACHVRVKLIVEATMTDMMLLSANDDLSTGWTVATWMQTEIVTEASVIDSMPSAECDAYVGSYASQLSR